jgi:hypothetical protein
MENPRDHLTIKIGKWFEATATGPYAITVLAVLFAVECIGRFSGLW